MNHSFMLPTIPSNPHPLPQRKPQRKIVDAADQPPTLRTAKIMHAAGPNNPLHGITLEKMLIQLEAHYGWEGLGDRIRINCFTFNPSIKSSLSFLRKTPWARAKVEELYLYALPDLQPEPPAAPEAEGEVK